MQGGWERTERRDAMPLRRVSVAWLGLWLWTTPIVGCEETQGVGDPCTPEDEYSPEFSGFAVGEVSVESQSAQCPTGICIVRGFQGRVSCPYGTNGPSPDPNATPVVDHPYGCTLPDSTASVMVPVPAWRTEFPAELGVYCSCRCGGADRSARSCTCPSGFACAPVGQDGMESYCIRVGSNVDTGPVDTQTCELNLPGESLDPLRHLTCGPPPADYLSSPAP